MKHDFPIGHLFGMHDTIFQRKMDSRDCDRLLKKAEKTTEFPRHDMASEYLITNNTYDVTD